MAAFPAVTDVVLCFDAGRIAQTACPGAFMADPGLLKAPRGGQNRVSQFTVANGVALCGAVAHGA